LGRISVEQEMRREELRLRRVSVKQEDKERG
jgi:hypothetical protein